MPLAYIPSPARSSWHLGPLPIRAQALCVVAGILLALWIADRRYRAAGGPSGVIADVAAWAIPAGLIPAALGTLLAQAHGPWQAVRTWDAVIGFPGAVAFGTLAAWLACRRLPGAQPAGAPAPRASRIPRSRRGISRSQGGISRSQRGRAPLSQRARTPLSQRGRRLRLGPVAGAVAPAIAFGQAVAAIGGWFAQQGFGHPSSLWWAVAISPAHRPPGYENFATFQPIFLYQALWSVTSGVTVAWAGRRFALPGERVFALWAATYAAGGFALFWLGIGHLPVVLGLRAGELGDAAVLVGATIYLARTRRMRTRPFQPAQKPALERDSPVM
jgi:prolipoprotein diacylglyceryltransferase